MAILYRGADHFSNFGRGSPEENFSEIILKSGNWPRKKCDLKVFSILSSGGHFVWRRGTILAIYVEGRAPKEHFCEIILKSGHWPRRRCRLKVFLFLALAAILFSKVEQFW